MPRKISRSPEWWEDVISTCQHIALDNIDSADEYLSAIEELLKRLMDFPELGERVHFANTQLDGLRVIRLSSTFHKHLVFYIPQKSSIHVARILHSARDIESLFAEE